MRERRRERETFGGVAVSPLNVVQHRTSASRVSLCRAASCSSWQLASAVTLCVVCHNLSSSFFETFYVRICIRRDSLFFFYILTYEFVYRVCIIMCINVIAWRMLNTLETVFVEREKNPLLCILSILFSYRFCVYVCKCRFEKCHYWNWRYNKN